MQRLAETLGFLGLFFSPRGDRAERVYELLSTHNNFAERSLFLNSGYWDGARGYDEACQTLALKVAEAADLGPADRVLDAGPGFGDQDLAWRARFQCREIVGINICATQVAEASHRVAAASESAAIRYLHGSATAIPLDTNSVDKVVAVESAFHFNTRAAFFREAYRVLKPGGRLALADLVPNERMTLTRAQRFIIEYMGRSFWQIPKANWHGRTAYVKTLGGAGFVDLSVVDISDKVFPGFRDHMKGRIDSADIRRRVNPLLRTLWRLGQNAESFAYLAYLLVSARKPA